MKWSKVSTQGAGVWLKGFLSSLPQQTKIRYLFVIFSFSLINIGNAVKKLKTEKGF